MELPPAEQLKASAITYLKEANEDDAVGLLRSCSLRVGPPFAGRYSQGEAHHYLLIELTCPPPEWHVLRNDSHPTTQAITDALNRALPPNVQAALDVHREPPYVLVDTEAPTATPIPSLPEWVPKTKRGLEKWQRAYNIILETRSEWEEGYYEGLYKDSPEPGTDDFREALAEKGLKYCPKRVRQIRQAGDEGWIAERLESLE